MSKSPRANAGAVLGVTAVLASSLGACTPQPPPAGTDRAEPTGAASPAIATEPPPPGDAPQSSSVSASASSSAGSSAAAPEPAPGRVRKDTARESCTKSCVSANQMKAQSAEAIEADCLRDCTEDPRSWPK